MVDLPAPFGPITASASPSSTARLTAVHGLERAVELGDSVEFQEDRHDELSLRPPRVLARRPFFTRPVNAQEYLIASNGLSSGMFGADLLKTICRSYLNFLPFFHCPPTSGVVQTFGTGLVGPPAFQVIGTDQRLVVGVLDGVADRAGVELLGALEDVDRDLEVGVLEADRLGPLLLGGRRVGVAELLRRLAGEARLERMMLRPPHFGRHADRRGRPAPRPRWGTAAPWAASRSSAGSPAARTASRRSRTAAG